jgi:undecaprenyl-diphosphatase
MTTTHVERPSIDPRPDHRSPYTLGQFHERFPWVLPVGVMVVSVLGVLAALDLLVWDEPITHWFVSNRTDALDTVARRISWFGSTKVVLVVAAVAAAVSWRKCPRLALAIIAIALARPLIEHGLKELVDRPRPQGDQLVPGRGPSFPSGHPLATAASWGLVPLVVGLYTAKRWIWWATAGAVWTLAVLVAASRVYLGVHWATDVVASLILATVGVLGAERFIDAVHGPECRRARPAHRT